MKLICLAFLLFVCVSNVWGHMIMGFQLPAKSSSPHLRIAGQPVESATIFGCKSKLENILRGASSKSSFISDPTCEVFLLPRGSELEAVELVSQTSFPKSVFNMTCDNLLIVLPAMDFSRIQSHLEQSNGNQMINTKSGTPSSTTDPIVINNQYIETDKCKNSGKVCISRNDVSLSLGCEGKGEVTLSTSGKVQLTIGENLVSVTVGN